MSKLWILEFFFFVSLWEVMFASFGGDYFVQLDKIDNQPELSREYADWHIFVRRISKKEKVVDGHYVVKKDIVGPKLVLTSYILSNNKFYRMALNELVPTNLCDLNIKKKYVDPYLTGNSSFSVPPDCVIKPGYMKLKNVQTLDSLCHDLMNKTIYGTYKLVGKILNKDNKTVGGATWVVTTKKRE